MLLQAIHCGCVMNLWSILSAMDGCWVIPEVGENDLHSTWSLAATSTKKLIQNTLKTKFRYRSDRLDMRQERRITIPCRNFLQPGSTIRRKAVSSIWNSKERL